MRYYSTQRPAAPGTFPGAGVIKALNFEDKKYIKSIGREAWGYIEYPDALSPEEIAAYELTPEGSKIWYCVTSKIDDCGACTLAKITGTQEAAERPESTVKSSRYADIWNDWFSSIEAANSFIQEITQ